MMKSKKQISLIISVVFMMLFSVSFNTIVFAADINSNGNVDDAKEALTEKITAAEVYTDLSIYTEVSKTAFETALSEAKAIMATFADEDEENDAEANDVDAASNNLANAQAGLVIDIAKLEITVTDATYTGSAITPVVTVKDSITEKNKVKTLTADTDYTVEVDEKEDNTNVGTASLTVTGKGVYGGTAKSTLTILPKDLSKATVTVSTTSNDYTGEPLYAGVSVVLDGKTLVKDTDYKVTISNDTNAGEMTVTVTGVNNYKGTASNKATINALDITGADFEITVDTEDKLFSGSPVETTVTITRDTGDVDGEGEPILVNLVEGTDYVVTYTNNDKVGTASLVVKGVGNYKGETTPYTFAIKNRANKLTISGVKASMTYTGEAIIQDITVKCDGVELPTSEYSVKYENNTNAGTAKIIVTCDGNYVGTATKTFKIVPQVLTEKDEDNNDNITVDSVTPYDGTEKKPEVTVLNIAGDEIELDKDYTVVYQNNVNGGTAKVTITGRGNYTGSITKEFTIAGKALVDADVEMELPKDAVYTGEEYKVADIVVVDSTISQEGPVTLVKDVDYKVEYTDAINAGEAKVAVVGKGNYAGTIAKSFTINAKDIIFDEDEKTEDRKYVVTVDETSKVAVVDEEGKAVEIKPEVSIVDVVRNVKLVEGTDYEVTYADNTVAGDATITVDGINNYAGNANYTFTIVAADKDIAKAVVDQKSIFSKEYDGTKQTQDALTVSINNTKLVKDTDYTVVYENNINAGTANAVLTGKGDYAGTKVVEFTITARKFDSVQVKVEKSSYTQTGSAIEPKVTVTDSNLKATLVAGTDYTVTYANNVEAGTAKVTVTGKGNFAGTKTATFTIEKGEEPVKPVDPVKPVEPKPEMKFKDLTEKWYLDAVKYSFENNIIKGYDEETFAPNDKLTRGMVVTILYRMEGEPVVSGAPKFSDVKGGYYKNAIKWASDNKIVNGYKNTNKFGPDDNVTREDLAIMLCNYAEFKGRDMTKSNDLKAFSDGNKVSKYAEKSVKWAVGSGVITGNKDKTLNPQGTATRAEAAAMFQKYCVNVGK